MPHLYFTREQLTSEQVRHDAPFIVAVPEAKRLAITLTYAGQLSPGHSVLMMLAKPEVVAKQITPYISSEISAESEEKLREVQLQIEALKADVDALNCNSAGRAKPFLAFAPYNIRGKIGSGSGLVKDDVNAIVKAWRKEKRPTASVSDKVRDYIHTGIADEETLCWLAENVDPIFAKPSQYADLSSQLQEMIEQRQNQHRDYSSLEHAVTEAVSAIKQGAGQQTDAEPIFSRAYRGLQKLIGAEPEKQFLWRIGAVVKGNNRNGILVPYHHQATNGTDIPDELKHCYLPTQRFTQIITVFDTALAKILFAYLNADEALQEHERLAVHDAGLLIRSLMPENVAVQRLYPNERVGIPGQPELSARIAARAVECYQNGQITELAAQQLRMGEEELSQEGLERLVSLLGKIMPVLPFEVYDYVIIRGKLSDFQQSADLEGLAEKIKSLGSQIDSIRNELKPSPGVVNDYNSRVAEHTEYVRQYRRAVSKNNELARKGRGYVEQLKKSFGVDVLTMTKYDATTIEEAITLFGEEFSFVRNVLEKSEKIV